MMPLSDMNVICFEYIPASTPKTNYELKFKKNHAGMGKVMARLIKNVFGWPRNQNILNQ